MKQVTPDSKASTHSASFIDRNFALASVVISVLADNAELRDSLPRDARLVVIPLDDPELAQFNLQLAQGKPDTVYVCVKRVDETSGRMEVLPWLPGQSAQRYVYG